jgi:hypothetical protein
VRRCSTPSLPLYSPPQVAVVLEFMDLGSLDAVLARAPGRRIPESALAGIAFQALWGLGYLAHDRRVHRDVKPQVRSAVNIGRSDAEVSEPCVLHRPSPPTRLCRTSWWQATAPSS